MVSNEAAWGVNQALSMITAGAVYVPLLLHVPQRPEGANYPRRLAMFLQTSRKAHLLEVFMGVLSVFSCVTLIWETYLDEVEQWMIHSEIIFSTFFMWHYIILFAAAERKLVHVFTLQPLVDLVTVVPFFALLWSGSYSDNSLGFLRISRIMKFARVLRLLRLIRSAKVVSSATTDAIQNNVVQLTSLVLSLIVCTTGFVQFMANEIEIGQWGIDEDQQMQFHDALYFTIVTFSTVGYGDISPSGAVGRVVMLIVTAFAFISIPVQMNKLTRLFRMRSSYAGSIRIAPKESHTILCCDPTCTGIEAFLREFFHEDHGSQNSRVCVLSPGEPSTAQQELILKYNRMTYLNGDLLVTADMQRANTERADAVFILADRYASDTDAQDSLTILRAMNVRRYEPTVPIFVQVLEPENKHHVVEAGVPLENILCINEMKLALMAQAVRCRGLSTMLANLVTSSGIDSAPGDPQWFKEYAHGLGQELYCVDLGDTLGGTAFNVAAARLCSDFGLLLVGIKRVTSNSHPEVLLNPGATYNIQPQDMGFIIAEDQAEVERMHRQLRRQARDPQTSQRRGSGLKLLRSDSVNNISQSTMNYTMKNGHIVLDPSQHYKLQGLSPVDEDSKAPDQSVPLAVRAFPTRMALASGGQRRGSLLMERLSSSSDSRCKQTKVQGSVAKGPGSLVLPSPREGPPATRLPPLQTSPGAGLPRATVLGAGAEALPQSASPMASETRAPERPAIDIDTVSKDSEEPGIQLFFGTSRWGQVRLPLYRGLRSGDLNRKIRRERVLGALSQHLQPTTAKLADLDPEGAARTAQVCEAQLQRVRRIPQLAIRPSAPQNGSMDCAHQDSVQFATKFTVEHMLSGHVVVVVADLDDMGYFLRPMRSETNAIHEQSIGVGDLMLQLDLAGDVRKRPIVFLCESRPHPADWDRISHFKDIHIIQGSALQHGDLRRAGISTAFAFLATSCIADGSRSQYFAGDAATILAIRLVRRYYPHVKTMAEVNFNGYIRHLAPGAVARHAIADDADFSSQPAYAEGDVLGAEFLETLICQAFFNPYIIPVITSFILGGSDEEAENGVQERGRAASVSSAAGPHPEVPFTSTSAAAVQLCQPPPEIHGMCYTTFAARVMRENGAIPLGLYRKRGDGTREKQVGFVATNPDSSFTILPSDLVYLLLPCSGRQAALKSS